MPDSNKPSPRPGFTQSLSGERETTYPVVVGVTDSAMSVLALRRAADEAAHRSVPLHVIAGGPAEETLESAATDAREMQVISSLLNNRHVTVSIVDPATADALLGYCKDVSASLLVIGCDEEAGPDALDNPATAHRLVDEAGCDVLVVHGDEQHGHH